jgi:hypothetical protein
MIIVGEGNMMRHPDPDCFLIRHKDGTLGLVFEKGLLSCNEREQRIRNACIHFGMAGPDADEQTRKFMEKIGCTQQESK